MELLTPVVQHYAWGDVAAIPALLGHPVSDDPAAELWMGGHPKAPGHLSALDTTLDLYIAADPDATLGPAAPWGQLPFLFKVLAAAEPLSIQAHPSLRQAQVGFARENGAGIDLAAFDRTYRDANHKPELICALTPFEAKCGFRPLTATRRLFDLLDDARLDGVRALLARDDSPEEVLADTLEALLQTSPVDAAAIVDGLLAAAHGVTSEEFAADLGWVPRIAAFHPGDIGNVVALLLNHVTLSPGEAIYLDAGNLHAYLKGVGMELMANSDNVVRGGLTPKHIDTAELLAILDFRPIDVPRQRPEGATHTYRTPAPEFALTRIELSDTEIEFKPAGPEIVIVVEGEAVLDDGAPLPLLQGQVAFIEGSTVAYRVRGAGLAFRAAVNEISSR